MRAKFWLNACKKKSWIRHLFGQISNPLMANRGVEKWILSLADTLAAGNIIVTVSGIDCVVTIASG